ncbi:MAG: ABC transporter permease [Candidatus Krumholzibacteriia bacterium]
MNAILLIVRNDMKRRLRSPVSVICMFLIPLGLTLLVGLVFGRHGKVELSHIKVLVADSDKGIAANFLKQGMKQGKLAELIDLVEVDSVAGRSLMDRGKASALIEIPKGFTVNILDRKPVVIGLVKNPQEAFLPLIVEEITETMAVMIDGAARIFEKPIGEARGMLTGGRWPEAAELAGLLSSAKPRIELVKGYLSDTLISITSETVSAPDAKPERTFNFLALIMPGSILIGLLFISEITMRDILREREAGTLARIIAGPVRSDHVIAGKMLSSFAITLVACALLIAIGRLGFGIAWGSPLKLIVHVVGSILMCVGLMAFLYGFIRSERVADAMLPVVIIILCVFGGAMFPYEVMSPAMQKAAVFSPAFWVIDGLKRIAIEKTGWGGIAPHLAIVYGLGAVTSVAGAAKLRGKLAGKE